MLKLKYEKVAQVALGMHHVVVLCASQKVFSWGKNDKGQLGKGFESNMEVVPSEVSYFSGSVDSGDYIVQVAAGAEYSLALVIMKKKKGKTEDRRLYGWGDNSYGQLGNATPERRHSPQENTLLTAFTNKRRILPVAVAAGGYHVLIATNVSGQVISYGASDYGQLGHGTQYDSSQPRFIDGLKGVIRIAAGLRHSMCLIDTSQLDDKKPAEGDATGQSTTGDNTAAGSASASASTSMKLSSTSVKAPTVTATTNAMASTNASTKAGLNTSAGTSSSFAPPGSVSGKMSLKKPDAKDVVRKFGIGSSACVLYSWGQNDYGQLGLGDTDIRIIPTKVTAFRNARIVDMACGYRHSVVVVSHKPLKNKETHSLKPYYSILEEANTDLARQSIKLIMKKKGLDPALLDDPEGKHPHQGGETDETMKNDVFEKGLRYVLKYLECVWNKKI